MPTIAVVDDRRGLRNTLTLMLSTALPDGWDSVGVDPWGDLADYPSWITENEVSVLILDERLSEQAQDSESHVAYEGHDLVDFLRQRFATLPIYIITSFDEDDSLRDRFKDVEQIIKRDEFLKDVSDWVPRITRAGQKYFETVQEQLSELADVSQRIATGEAENDDEDRAKALQSNLNMPFGIDQLSSRSEWLGKLDQKLDELESLKGEIEGYLGSLREHEMDKNS